MMRQGGNGQIREFYKKLQIENSPITILYSTKGANHYRDRLKERADKVISFPSLQKKLSSLDQSIHSSQNLRNIGRALGEISNP